MYRTGHSTAGPGVRGHRRLGWAKLLLGLLAWTSCDSGTPAPAPPAGHTQPNILLVVWDTVRADRMSLYGHSRETTPMLDAWARQAVVFEDVVSAAGYTVPSHASLFTGLLPSEHCATGGASTLREDYTTLAEILRDEGYATFLYAENPHLAQAQQISQGFSQHQHPWSARYLPRARAILKGKVEGDSTSELRERVAEMERGEGQLTAWNVKAAGELAEHAVLDFLDNVPPTQPFFVFVNYMEAHRPYIPPRKYRRRFMTPEQVERSYQVDRSWETIWEYTFARRELSEEALEITRATYDAALLELDDLFGSLLNALEARGALQNTIVALTSDHGEHLGEHHMFDHQSTLYEPVLRVPLVLSYPGTLAPARRSDPVMNFDLFPTLLELAGVEHTTERPVSARSLLEPDPERARLAQEPEAESSAVRTMRRLHPGWDPAPWLRSQRALYRGRYKWIAPSVGDDELYDLERDPTEARNLASLREIDASILRATLAQLESELTPCAAGPVPTVSDRDRELLEMLGYGSAEDSRASQRDDSR